MEEDKDKDKDIPIAQLRIMKRFPIQQHLMK